MSDKFISASEIRELLGIAPDGDCEKCRFRGMFGCQKSRDFVRVCEAIDDCSAADVRLVVRGTWIHREAFDYYDQNNVTHFHAQCSNCGFLHDFIDCHSAQYLFCPECGADMRPEGRTKE